MLTAQRALTLSSQSSPELPRVPALGALYQMGVRPRVGEVIMIAGRSGTQKSGFALWWVLNMGLPTLYFSADMSAYQASVRIACSKLGMTTDQVEAAMSDPRTRAEYMAILAEVPITFSFGSPISWRSVDLELDAYIELHNAYPQVIVVDNLMDVEGASADYTAQMEAMQNISDLSRSTGATVIVLHHASDKSWEAKSDPWRPPSRDQVKGGMSEKPELSLSVALDPMSYLYRVACLKQRMGPSDPSAQRYATLRADPERTLFLPDGLEGI
ncbi:AAA family ATPase [Cellulosimicrobium sp. TH-20]|uniref:AAA family ATPase n=1 Tax=Cellulosimicrobium sp. TH-20 TaxID=1980001 RepID=UPI00119CCB1C|nr:AAA family ATPase [Cellulosimicrobium sp. TH-20]